MSRLITDVGLAPLTVSLVSSSLLLFGNGILEIIGPVPIIRNKDSPLSLSPKQKVQIWATYFRGVAVISVGSALLNSALCIYMAVKTSNPDIKKYAIVSAIGSNTLIPYTLVVLGKTNSSLLALDKEAESRDLTTAEESEGERLIERWVSLHRPRFASFVVAWTGSLLAFFTGVQGLRL